MIVSLSPANSPLRQEHHRSRRRSAAPRSCLTSWDWSSRSTMGRFIRMLWSRRRWSAGSWGSLLREFFLLYNSLLLFTFSFRPGGLEWDIGNVVSLEDLKVERKEGKIWWNGILIGVWWWTSANWLVLVGLGRGSRISSRRTNDCFSGCVFVWLAGWVVCFILYAVQRVSLLSPFCA